MHRQRHRTGTSVAWVVSALLAVTPAVAGSLDPPGPPAPTMKTLADVEPRTPVETLAGSADALHVIDEPGSYYLTADLLGEPGKSGIFIEADDVVLDLNGFSVVGVTGARTGVLTRAGARNLIVFNGTVGDWPEDGIGLQTFNGLVHHVLAAGNGGAGIAVWIGNVTFSTALGNGDGIRVDGPGVIENSAAAGNGNGIKVVGQVTVRHCQAQSNAVGFLYDFSGALVDSLAVENTTGASLYQSTFVSGTTFRGNETGLEVRGGGKRNRIEANTFSQNNFGVFIDTGASANIVLRNAAHGNLYGSYVMGSGNSHGPVADVSGVGDISTVPAAANPWANFRF